MYRDFVNYDDDFMEEILKNLYLGNAKDAATLVSPFTGDRVKNIHGVVNCTSKVHFSSQELYEIPNYFEKDLVKFEYLNLDLVESSPITEENAVELHSFISRYIDSGKGVLVHCKAGQQRSPSTIIVYLLKEGYDILESIEVIASKSLISPTRNMITSITNLSFYDSNVTVDDIMEKIDDYNKKYFLKSFGFGKGIT
jgi:hypothetical protein